MDSWSDPTEGEFMFCHALIRDGAYASLLHERRRILHARAAEWMVGRDLVLAAEHFDLAEDARAAGAYLAASEALNAQFRHKAALRSSSAASPSRPSRRRASRC